MTTSRVPFALLYPQHHHSCLPALRPQHQHATLIAAAAAAVRLGRYRFRRFRRSNQEPLLAAKSVTLHSSPSALVRASVGGAPEADPEAPPVTMEADASASPPSPAVSGNSFPEAVPLGGEHRSSGSCSPTARGPGPSPTAREPQGCAGPSEGSAGAANPSPSVTDRRPSGPQGAQAAREDSFAPLRREQGSTEPSAKAAPVASPFLDYALQPSGPSLGLPVSQPPTEQGALDATPSQQQLTKRPSWIPGPLVSAASALSRVTSSALLATTRTITKLVPTPKPTSALAHVDRSLPLLSQLGIVLWVAVFVLYPSWVQTTLGIFACYVIDDGKGPYAEHQQVGESSGREAGTGCNW